MNKKNAICALATGLSFLLLASGCAREVSEDGNAAAIRRFESWLSIHHPDAVPVGSGIYILSDTPGEGPVWDGETNSIAYMIETRKDLQGNISSTNDEAVAKQIGSWSREGYYGPSIWYVTRGAMYEGLIEALEVMDGIREGGRRTVIIPSWLLTYKTYDTAEEYREHATGLSDMVIDIQLVSQADNVFDYQIRQLEDFTDRYLAGVDSTYYNNEDGSRYGFYYHQLRPAETEEAMPSDTTVYINYTGRRLDGVVFDTTIADTAKFYGIYSSSKTYQPVSVQWGSQYDAITMTSSSTEPIDGFQMALWRMRPGEKGITAFYSELGYGSSGSSSTIPSYAPLSFTIELVEKP